MWIINKKLMHTPLQKFWVIKSLLKISFMSIHGTMMKHIKHFNQNFHQILQRQRKTHSEQTTILIFSKLDKSTPNSANLQKIAEFFNVSIEYLIYGKDKTYSEKDALLDAHISEDVELKEAIKKYYTLDEKARKYILEGIDLLWRESKTDTK